MSSIDIHWKKMWLHNWHNKFRLTKITKDSQHSFEAGHSFDFEKKKNKLFQLSSVRSHSIPDREIEETDFIISDLSPMTKAFDKVPCDLLFHKLNHYGCLRSVFNWIKASLSVSHKIVEDDQRREIIVLDSQGTQQRRSELPVVTPHGMWVNKKYTNFTKGAPHHSNYLPFFFSLSPNS